MCGKLPKRGVKIKQQPNNMKNVREINIYAYVHLISAVLAPPVDSVKKFENEILKLFKIGKHAHANFIVP